MFKGSICALITPFKGDEIDESALEALVNWHVEQGTHGLVPCGTTGESPTLSHKEHDRVIEIVVSVAAGRVPVIAGTGSNSTKEAVRLTQNAAKAGADAALVVTPYYNKPNQEGLYQHYRALSDCSDIPIFIYNIPGRCVIDMSVATMARLAELKNIVGVKDATADLMRPAETLAAIGPEFIQLSGEDGTVLPFMAAGGHGCISVTANVAPRLCADFQEACLAGDYETARQLNAKLMPLHAAMFVDTNPAPAKYGVSQLGFAAEDVRGPLVALTEEARVTVRSAMKGADLI